MSSQRIVELLNEAFRLDPVAVSKIFGQRFECNAAIGDHPTIVVDVENGGDRDGRLTISALGLLQGIAGPDGHLIWGVYDDETLALTGFRLGSLSS